FYKPPLSTRGGIGAVLLCGLGVVGGGIRVGSKVGWEGPAYFTTLAGVGTTVRSPDVTVAKI
ncbi:MAG: hypothetical protein OXM87_03830, partial [Truepera sp.]|nr:hypothetical protein [Truepera sp.]